jgi:hypothetical protein
MRVESGMVRTHVRAGKDEHVIGSEVLRGVLYPEVHDNGFEKKQKQQRLFCFWNPFLCASGYSALS